jgi:sulfopyruvate decarboxylase subunit alpha
MKESAARMLVEGLKEAGIEVVACLPEGLLKPLYNMLRADKDLKLIFVTNEGEGAGIAAGAWLGGKKSVVIMENSGLRMSTEVLARLGLTHGIPVMMIMSHRGEIGEANWWGIAHSQTMEPILKALNIPYIIIRDEGEIKGAIRRACRHMATSLYHVALVMSGGTLQGDYV